MPPIKPDKPKSRSGPKRRGQEKRKPTDRSDKPADAGVEQYPKKTPIKTPKRFDRTLDF